MTATRISGGRFPQTWSTGRTVTKIHIHALNTLMLIGLICALAPAASAQGDNDSRQKAIAKAHRFLSTEQRAKATLNFVHFGTDYKGQKYLRTTDVMDGSGTTIEGQFALTYRLFWNDDGVTDIAYLCYPNGKVYEVVIVKTNAEGNQPFLWANLSIQVLGNLFIEAYKDKLTPDDRRLLQKLVDNADAKGLLELTLRIDQFASD